MEKSRHRRSRSATSVEGNFQVRQHKVGQHLVSDSHSYSEGISKEDVNAAKRGIGTPIKKLLAEEMAKAGEVKRRSPNVIARLMGLDGLPSPQVGQRQQKKLFEKHQQKNTSRNIHQNDHLYEDQSSRRSSVDQKDFKDVYEDLEASHVINCRYSSKWNMNSGLIKPEMELIQQKFMDAKRLSCSAELQVSKEFDDTLEMLDSNKDLLLRYLQQPDSLFTKPLHDLQVASSRTCYDRMASLEATNSRAKGWKSERHDACKYSIGSHPKREDGLLLQSNRRHNPCSPCDPSRNHLDVQNEENVLPTRIVVLKPNIGKIGNSVTSVSSPESSHTHLPSYRKNLEHRTAKSDEVVPWKRKTSSSGVISSSSKSREDRAFAREITRKMRENFESFGSGLNILTHSGARGYAGDESSYDAYESDSSSESGVKTVSPSNALDWNNWCKRPSSRPNESMVSKEAKKRMSERWKMTHRCQDVESFGKGSTLGEMLAVPDKETKHETLMILDGGNENLSCHSHYLSCDSPLGISSRDGWKDGCLKNSSRSRSLPPSLISSRSYRSNGRLEDLVITNETKYHRRSKTKKGNLIQREDYSSGDKSSSRKPYPCSEDANSSPDVNASLIQANIGADTEDKNEKDIMLSMVPSISDPCPTSITDVVPDSIQESLTSTIELPVDLQFRQSDNVTQNSNSDAHQETMGQQDEPVSQSELPSPSRCPGPELESSESSKEADHPSPISVLEASFVEDASSGSDCFERVNADLHELRMQLQLLKMESGGGYADTEVLATSSNELEFHQSERVLHQEGRNLDVQGWKSVYIDEVLFNAGLDEFSADTFLGTWHSPECPLDPWVFDNLEKNYGEETTSSRCERKLLFDRINLALIQMFKHHMDPCPWVKLRTCAVNLKWHKYEVKDALVSFLANQEIEANGENPEKALDREMCWLGFRDDIDTVGKEIEKMLISDLVGELLTM